jgi:2-C-methyl-D-erythritol 4-phosphate cytidylyltransferase
MGRPLWWWAFRPILEFIPQAIPVVVIPEGHLEKTKESLVEAPLRTVEGGRTREVSVRHGLTLLRGLALDLILVHDGARPCLEGSLLPALLERALVCGAATLGIPIRDALKEVKGLEIVRDVQRDGLYAIQTPQAFHPEILHGAHDFAKERNIDDAPDDAYLVQLTGKPVCVVPGSPFNIKVTFPEDFRLVSRYLTLLTAAREPQRPWITL